MSENVYTRLAEHLDNLPAGFPATESGVELRILKRLFTPEQAKLAVHLTLLPETPRTIARRAGLPLDNTEASLVDMAKLGLISRHIRDGRPTRYTAAQFVIGIWEFHLNQLDEGLIQDMEEYIPHLMYEAWQVPQLRTIPVNESVTHELQVLPYEHAGHLLEGHIKIAVAPCICRKERNMVGEGCGKPLETCMMFDGAAQYYVDNDMGRFIDIDEARQLLIQANEAGLVLQPGNNQTPGNICMCCGDCCGVLRTLNDTPAPAELVSTPFFAVVNADDCIGCGICIQRCQMHAINVVDNKAIIALERCIGCGLCVSTCPTDAMQLRRKQDAKPVPGNFMQTYLKLARSRGKFIPLLERTVSDKVKSVLKPNIKPTSTID